MIEVPQGDWDGRGLRWMLIFSGDLRTAALWCPKSHMGFLHDHIIDKNGRVNPSVVCPDDKCWWHEYVRLVGWSSS